MNQIILNEEQAKVAASLRKPVPVCDDKGNLLGTYTPLWTEEDIAEAKRRLASPGVCFTSAQVQSRLEALQQEWERTGGFDEAYMKEFLKHLDEADPGHVRPARPIK
jgi:hypothetical protein